MIHSGVDWDCADYVCIGWITLLGRYERAYESHLWQLNLISSFLMNIYAQLYVEVRLNKRQTMDIYDGHGLYMKTCNWNYTRNQKKFLLQPNVSFAIEYKQY